MKVGDLVGAGKETGISDHQTMTGIVLSIEYVHAGQYWVTCLWDDGIIEGCEKSDLYIINRGRTE